MSEAEAFCDELLRLAGSKSKLALDQLWMAFRHVVRGYTGSAEARGRLATLLEELEHGGRLASPRSERNWDASAEPRLPLWIRLLRAEAPAPAAADPRVIAWPPELAFAAGVRRSSLVNDLLAVRTFLAHGGRERPLVPTRERSLQIFGDEKRLDALRKTSVFRPGRLSLELLRCHDVAPPLVWDPGPPSAELRPLLVLENLHSHDTFRRWNAERGDYSAVAYGHGSEFKATCRDLPRLCEKLDVSTVEYFGDLDQEGLRIPHHAKAVLAELAPGLTFRPATSWYQALVARAADAIGSDTPMQRNEPSLSWLPAELRSAACALLVGGKRLPQELIGCEYLAALPRPADSG